MGDIGAEPEAIESALLSEALSSPGTVGGLTPATEAILLP